ncbi:hypothetical protein LTR37_000067 [Vermiconidia calcicola]|uniref:Uncharacterized protein n=1 Tax=Vermiconidia calcicola TaxID=1690605 RepID=A0ACC3P1Q2_9PEZI|nr:hypothetical protein LTR37_000067 [Vermiconidia calcicola]
MAEDTTAPFAPSDFHSGPPLAFDEAFEEQEGLSAIVPEVAQTNGPPKVQVDSHGRTLNPRSCVTCRKRKVKCDKTHPCSNCNRAHIECVFPGPGRAPRKARKTGDGRDKELLERLRRLEGVVKGMGVEVPADEKENSQAFRGQTEPRDRAGSREGPQPQQEDDEPTCIDRDLPQEPYDIEPAESAQWVQEQQQGRLENQFGRLVVNEGKSRYVNSSFWANLSNEVEDLKGILNQSSDDEDMDSLPGSHPHPPSGSQQGWIFGFSSQNVDILSLHPLPDQISEYWALYKDRVDPLVKVLHIPTMEPTVLRAASHLSRLSKGFEALLFAIYYGATTSLNPEDCIAKFGEERSVLLARYRFAIEQALARASFLTTEETVVLQAFVIFLMCLRRNNDARVIWTLTGLIVRIAQTLGVHRDGSHFGLSPFEVEMRRRLWWQVCILDIRASEDHGCDPTILEQAFDTKMPLNINDIDINPNMKEFPLERQGCTDMSFCLIRFEVANTFRRINYVPPGPPRACQENLANVTLEDKEKWITECHQRLEERYLKHCDMSVPLFWVTATVARLMMSKMWLMVYHPFQGQDGGASLPNVIKEKLFITSLENIEYAILLETEARTMKWGWLFKTYMQRHALAFILSELCHRTTGDLVDRAWNAVEKTRDGRWGMQITGDDPRSGHVWRPLMKLYQKAKAARQRGLQEEALTKQRALPPQRTYTPNTNPMFEHPNRPRMTRAPLSQAQASRFANGPTFGQMPVDKHELFRSPSLSGSVEQDEPKAKHAVNSHKNRAPVQPPLSDNNVGMLSQQSIASYTNPSYLNDNFGPTTPQMFAPAARVQNWLQDGTSALGSTNTDPTNGTDINDFNNLSGGFGNDQSTMPAGPSRMNCIPMNDFELADLDMSLMTNANVSNWGEWSELTRQFEMEVDQGMGGGDWF